MKFDKFYVSLLNNLATVFSELYITPQFLLQICNLQMEKWTTMELILTMKVLVPTGSLQYLSIDI